MRFALMSENSEVRRVNFRTAFRLAAAPRSASRLRLKKSQLTQNLLAFGIIFGLRNQFFAEQIGQFLQPIINAGATGRRNSWWSGRRWVQHFMQCVRGESRTFKHRRHVGKKWTPSFRPLSAENKMDSVGLLSFVFLFVSRSFCALKPFGKERTSRVLNCPSSLSLFLGFPTLPPQAV